MAAKTRTPAAPALMGDWQRRVVLVLLFAGVALAIVGASVPPRGGLYWLAVLVAPLLGGGLGLVLAGGPGRTLETRLIASDAPPAAPAPPAPAALPPPQRLALQTAVLPLLLSELARAADRMAPRERAAALALVEAGATAPESEARQALARDLPGLITGLAAGGATAAGAAEELARRLALPGAAR